MTARSLSVVAAAVVCVTPATASALSPPRPNVLVIVTDDQRHRDTMSVLPEVRGWFGEAGTTFERAFVTTPTCCPSRASIFTGQYAHNHGVLTTQSGEAERLDQASTLQRHLGHAGYRTAIFGKYLNDWDVDMPPPHFDRYAMFSDDSKHYYRNGLWNIDGEVRRVSTYSTIFIRELATDFIATAEADDDRPWMLFLTPMAPHGPTTPEEKYRDADVPPFRPTPGMRERDRSDKPEFARFEGPTLDEIRALRRRHLRALMSVDDLVAAVHSALVEASEADDTLAIYTSDNGLMWGEHGLTGKGVAYEPAVQVPMLATWPGRIEPEERDRRLVANIDIAATIYDALDIVPGYAVDGRSLLSRYARERLLLEHWKRDDRQWANWAAHRFVHAKYIEVYAADHLVPEWREYYGYDKDPWELDNRVTLSYVGTRPDPTLLRADLACTGTAGPRACP